MKLWLSKNSEIPIGEQLIIQITLGILSGDLQVDEKLPSTREIARRFGVHPNTIGLAYQKLSRQDVIRLKKGSGFFVCKNHKSKAEFPADLDNVIAAFFQNARDLGFSEKQIKSRLQNSLDSKLPGHILVVEEDKNLRRILVEEIKSLTNLPVSGIGIDEIAEFSDNPNLLFTALINEKNLIIKSLQPESETVFLSTRSVSHSMKGKTKPEKNELTAIISGWDKFLLLAKTFLLAANIDKDSIIIRSTLDTNWKRGINKAGIIICDSLTAKSLKNDVRVQVFPLISDQSIKKLNKYVSKPISLM